jgi:hypothetical protein
MDRFISLTEDNARLREERERLRNALRDLLDVVAEDDLIPESVSYMKQAREALSPHGPKGDA